MLSVLAGEMSCAERAQRCGVSTGLVNKWRHQFLAAGAERLQEVPSGPAKGVGTREQRRLRMENEQLKLASAVATLQLRIWHRGAAFADHVPSRTSKPSERQRVCRFRGFASWPTSRNPPIGDGAHGCVTGNPPTGRGRPRWRIVSRRWRLNTPRPGRPGAIVRSPR